MNSHLSQKLLLNYLLDDVFTWKNIFEQMLWLYAWNLHAPHYESFVKEHDYDCHIVDIGRVDCP